MNVISTWTRWPSMSLATPLAYRTKKAPTRGSWTNTISDLDISAYDRARLHRIYQSHTRGVGW